MLKDLFNRFIIGVHAAYKKCLSPFFGNRCRFYPSCSDYCRDALLTHGAVRGGLLSISRICRCHPLCEGGVDPVPAAK